ncbi:MAG: sensor histidine kinase [Bacteroides sp.]
MKNVHIKIITIVGLIAILGLQIMWLYSTYSIINQNLSDDCYRLFEEASFKEATSHFSEVPSGTKALGAPRNKKDKKKKVLESTYLLESFLQFNIDINIENLDSIYTGLLKEKGIDTSIYIERIKASNHSIIGTTQETNSPMFGAIKTQMIPIRLDESQAVQATILSPYYTVFQRMILLMLATVIMMIIVVSCIIYQIKIITRQNKIARIREDFSYAMIHDMKTPLSSIMMCTNFIHSGKLDHKPELKEKYFNIIEQEGEHLLKLTDKVLTLSKLENHKLELSFQLIDLPSMIADLIEKFSAKANKPIHFATHLEAQEVCADEDFLREVLSNLIDNAIKYSKSIVNITISSSNNNDYTLIKVHDDGLGISEKDQKTIFEKFERASAVKLTRKGGPSGFGLGLNYVYQVIQAHRGKVYVNSIEGEFTEFTLYLPLIMKDYD